MGIVESPQHFPKVPAEAVVQRICSYASRFQQLIELVMSEEKKYSVRYSASRSSVLNRYTALCLTRVCHLTGLVLAF